MISGDLENNAQAGMFIEGVDIWGIFADQTERDEIVYRDIWMSDEFF